MIDLAPALKQIGPDEKRGFSAAIYVVGEGDRRAIVDAGDALDFALWEQELIDNDIDPATITDIYITHGHSDHYEGAVLFREKYPDVNVYIGSGDQRAVETADYYLTAGFFYGKQTLPLLGTLAIGDGFERRYRGVAVRAHETPGHTEGSMSYELLIKNFGRVGILGDTAWGGWSPLIGSRLDLWRGSVDKLIKLNLDYLTFGHGVTRLVEAKNHLGLLASQIGQYGNAYDHVPLEYYYRFGRKPSDVVKDKFSGEMFKKQFDLQ